MQFVNHVFIWCCLRYFISSVCQQILLQTKRCLQSSLCQPVQRIAFLALHTILGEPKGKSSFTLSQVTLPWATGVLWFSVCGFFKKLMQQNWTFFVSTSPYKHITNSGLSNDRSSFRESTLHPPLWLLHTKTEGRTQGLLQDWYGMVTQPDTLLWSCSFESTHAITERKEKRREESKDGKNKRNKHDISRNQQSAKQRKKARLKNGKKWGEKRDKECNEIQ